MTTSPTPAEHTALITHEVALNAIQRLVNGSFHQESLPTFHIPARPDLDDDLVACAYVRQRKEQEATAVNERGALLKRVRVLEEALREGRRAIGEHFAPNDCYATGPLTGDSYRDLVECPACSFIKMHDAALQPEQETA